MVAGNDGGPRLRFGRSALLLFFWILSTSPSAEAADAASLVKKVQPSVLLILERKPSGETAAVGSGFLVSADGKLVTNDHGSDRAEDLSARAEDGRIYRVMKILERDPRRDRELLQLNAKNLPFLHLSSPVSVREGEAVVIVSSRFAGSNGISPGRALVEHGLLTGGRLLVLTTAASRLFPGSPAVGEEGQVLGVATTRSGRSKSGNLVIPVTTIGTLSVSRAIDPPNAMGVNTPPAPVERPNSSSEADLRKAPGPPAETGDAAERALRFRPRDARAWLGVASAALALQKRREAEAALGQVRALAPNDVEIWIGVAKDYSRLGRPEDEAAAYQRAVDLNPKDARALLGLGFVSIELGRTEQAEDLLSRLLELNQQMGMELVEALKKQ